jgi:hypothetical protein
MIPTITGVLICLIGAFLLFRPTIEMLGFSFFCTLLPAASAIDHRRCCRWPFLRCK